MTPRPDRPARLGVFISGGGRTMCNLHDATRDGRLDAEIALVLASRDCPGVGHARERGLTTIVVPGDLTPERLDAIVDAHALDWIVLAGYLRLLPITGRLRGRVVNIHPALLPAHGGPGMHGRRVHEAVLRAGETVSGCSVHLCDDRYDTGPVLAQATCPVHADDTPETLAARVFGLECELYPRTLERLISGELPVCGGDG
ncbi:MAG: phosphoribosylglycinamide formyltransferase [Phycisphaerales bacterium]